MRISDWSSDVCSSDLLDIKAGGRIPIFYRGSVKPGERVCHIPKRLDVGIMVEIFQSGTVSGRDLKCRFSVPPKDATITVAKTRSEEHTSELQSLMRISYAVFCLKTNIKQHS